MFKKKTETDYLVRNVGPAWDFINAKHVVVKDVCALPENISALEVSVATLMKQK